MDNKKVELVLSRGHNLPCLWESGGGYTSTGEAIILTNSDGSKPRSIYIKRKGTLACSKHALIPIKEDMIYISLYHHRGDFDIVIYKISEIDLKNKLITLSPIFSFREGVWDKELPEYLKEAVQAGIEKANDYHCRTPYYCIEPKYKIV